MHPALVPLLADQDGVVSRRQAHEVGVTDNDLRRLLRGRHLTRLHSGVYLDHTGEPSWQQLAWAAVLCAGPRPWPERRHYEPRKALGRRGR